MTSMFRLAYGQLALITCVVIHLLLQRRLILAHWDRCQHGKWFPQQRELTGDAVVDNADREKVQVMLREVEYFCDLTATRILLLVTLILSLVRQDAMGFALGLATVVCIVFQFYFVESLTPDEYFHKMGNRRCSPTPAILNHGMVVVLNAAPLVIEFIDYIVKQVNAPTS